jgi:hypothetical protein
VPVLTLLLAFGPLVACHKDKPQPAKAAVKSPAEIKKLADSARQSLAKLEPPLAAMKARFEDLHKEFDPLPPGLNGFGETRSEFYAAAEGLGMLSAQLTSLSGRVDAAVKAGDSAALDQINKDIDRTYAQVAKVDRISIELFHRVQPFKKAHEVKVEEILAKGQNKCD